MAKNIHVSDVPTQSPNNMVINTEMLTCKLANIKRTVQTTITGNRLFETDDKGKPVLDDDGKKIYIMKTITDEKTGKPKTVYDTEFDTIPVKVTVDLTGAPLGMLIDNMFDKSNSITVMIQNKYRPMGETAVRELDGTTIPYMELIKNERAKLSPLAKVDKIAETASADDLQKMIEQLQRKLLDK